jgi:hypothetical protein
MTPDGNVNLYKNNTKTTGKGNYVIIKDIRNIFFLCSLNRFFKYITICI